MDITTAVGLVAGAIVISTLILMGGDFRMFYDIHAVIIIFGGSIAATMIRFPLGVMLHGLPLGAKFVFTMSRLSARDLVDELARIAEIARKQGPVGLEKVETDEPFLAKGIRYVADGYDLEFIRDNMERDRDNFLMHLDEEKTSTRSWSTCPHSCHNVLAPTASMAERGSSSRAVRRIPRRSDGRRWPSRRMMRWSKLCTA